MLISRGARDFFNKNIRSNKFNKKSQPENDDLHSLIIFFINNFSNHDVKAEHKKLWDRIIASFDKLI